MFWTVELNKYSKGSSLKSFYADYESDVAKMPTQTALGTQSGGLDIWNAKCSAGSDLLVLETGELYILGMETNEWTKV